MPEKKKVYVETTFISDATALPARDIVQLGRQVITRGWLRMSMYLHAANASGRRPRMTSEKRYDDGLEEIWRIKREIAAAYSTLDDYFKGMMAYQEELKRQGVQFVRLVPRTQESVVATS